MNQLCFLSNLTSQEWSAWVQAIGSIVAIIAAVVIAIWQNRVQHKNDIALQNKERLSARIDSAKTIETLSKNAAIAMQHVRGQLDDREKVHLVAIGERWCDIGEIASLNSYFKNIPVHSLPSSLVSAVMAISSTVRQFKEKVEMALENHRQMNGDAFLDFFKTLEKMANSTQASCQDIGTIIHKMENNSEHETLNKPILADTASIGLEKQASKRLLCGKLGRYVFTEFKECR